VGLLDLPQSIIQYLNVLDLEKLKAFRFAVQIDGDFTGKEFVIGFADVQGLASEVDVKTVREGGYPGIHKFPRKARQGPLVLKRAMTFSRAMLEWYLEVRNWTKGKDDYTRSLSVFLLDAVTKPLGEVVYEVWRWDFFSAWPSKWQGPRLNAMQDSLAFESLTIEHSGIAEAKGIFSGQAGELLSVFK